MEGPLADDFHSIDLFPHTHGWSLGHDSYPCWYRYCQPNQLSGWRSVLHLPLHIRVLIVHNVKVWVSFVVVSTPSHLFRSKRKGGSHLICVFY